MRNVKKVFHPSYYIKEYIDELEITQDEFSKRLGISGKQVSLILKGTANITPDIALKLSMLMGTSVELWLNLQSKYDAYIVALKLEEEYENEKKIYKIIDKKFLKQLKIIDDNDNTLEGINKLRKHALVSSLSLLSQKDIYCFYRTSVKKEETLDNIVCRNLWVTIATQIAKSKQTLSFNKDKINTHLDEFKNMTLQSPEVFYPKMERILSECGVSLVILPSLKNSNINGVVKWLSNDKVMMALNTRGAYNDKFWFSFFHELKHVLQKEKRKMIIGECNSISKSDLDLENEADNFASEILISSNKLKFLHDYSKNSIINFANKMNVHPGIVVGRLQKLGKINYNCLNDLKEKYQIVIE